MDEGVSTSEPDDAVVAWASARETLPSGRVRWMKPASERASSRTDWPLVAIAIAVLALTSGDLARRFNIVDAIFAALALVALALAAVRAMGTRPTTKRPSSHADGVGITIIGAGALVYFGAKLITEDGDGKIAGVPGLAGAVILIVFGLRDLGAARNRPDNPRPAANNESTRRQETRTP